MDNQSNSEITTEIPSLESYSQHANADFEAELALRTAAKEGEFFLPFLRPGMRVLDLGCGPGSITLGLAKAVAPGEVVGVDLQPSEIAQAQALSVARGVTAGAVGYTEIARRADHKAWLSMMGRLDEDLYSR